MAKLNVVIPAVEVTVDGVTYRKVDRKAQAGDIVKALKSGVDLTEGAFYGPLYRNGVGNLGFYDDVDDFRYSLLRNYAEQFAVYAPISEPISEQVAETKPDTITFQGAEWRKVDRDVRAGDAIKFTDEDRSSYLTESELYVVDRIDSCDDPQITDDDGDEYDAGCEDYEVYEKVVVEYREVKRKAKVGERIKIVAIHPESMKVGSVSVGEEFTVKMVDATGDVWSVEERPIRGIISTSFQGKVREYVVLEPVTAQSAKPERLAVGDYARVLFVNGAYMSSNVKEGSIVKITRDDESHRPFQAVLTNGAGAGWFTKSELVRATDEEAAAAKDPRRQFAIGDYVKVAVEYCEHEVGDVLKITNMGGVHDFAVTNVATNRCGFIYANKIVKLTAEEVAEIERKQAEEARWSAIGRNVNEFKIGDIVEVTLTNSGHAVGTIGELVSGSHFAIPTEFGVRANGSTRCHLSGLKLVTPVEQRFDMKEVDAA
ncbi:hypothetical protein [Paenibacillus illinoisensis]|uniref:hypothetical protein n=1 Tax=Paenibacillus illinoisensis TaxID=59845 RepID=UPI00203AABA9|nr:hypothetical protein [Paenibacillus illinoisensis]MCM3205663.1 hypothetical protein [Paenibacillus illinoisensis]